MKDIALQLTDRYDKLRKELEHLGDEEALARAQALLRELRESGETVLDPEQRSVLSSLARDLGEMIFDVSNEYPSVRLAHPIRASVDLRGDRVHVGEIHFHGASKSIPLQRPPRTPHFTDREKELTHLLANLHPGRVITLCGPGGIGKTALAAEAAWTLAPENEPPERFPDGIIFYSFYGKPDPVLALEHIALSYGEEPEPTPADAAIRALSGKHALLILDSAEEAENLSAVLNARGNCGVLVTSRARQNAVAERQDLQPLAAEDAVALLRKWGGDRANDDRVAARICELAGYLPLAVRLVGRYLDETGDTAAEYLAWLRETPLEALNHGERRLESVDVLLEKSLAQVSEEACQVLGVVGLLALAPFDREPIAAALDLSPYQLHKPLGELVSQGLLSRSGERYGVSHALVHTYARERVQPEAGALTRLAEYYTALAETEREKGLEGYRCLDAEQGHLMSILRACVEEELWEAARSLVWAIGGVGGYLDIQGHWTEWVQALEMGVKAAQALDHWRDEGAFLGNLGIAYKNLGKIQQAIKYHEQALAISHGIDDRRNEGAFLGNLGLAYYSLGQIQQAIEYHEQALIIAREIGDRRNEGAFLGNLGLAYSDLGQLDRAIGYYEQSLAIAQEIGDQQGEGSWMGNLGLAYSDLGQLERAISYYKQSLDIQREIGDRRGEGDSLGNLGLAYAALGQVERAIEYYEQALTISREIGDRRGEGNRLGNLGLAYTDLGQIEKAIEYYQQALTIHREIGHRQGEAFDCWNLGLLYEDSDPARAVELMSVCVAFEREIGHPDAESDAKRVAQIKARIEGSE